MSREDLANHLATVIFDTIEKDRTLIKQNIAEAILKELVFRLKDEPKPYDPKEGLVPYVPHPWAPEPGTGDALPYWVNIGTSDRTEPNNDYTQPIPGRQIMADMTRAQAEARRRRDFEELYRMALFKPLPGGCRMKTRDKLVAELRKVAALASPANAAKYEAFVVRAATGEFDDYAEPSDARHACPIMQLHSELTAAGFTKFASRVANGEFDATKEESDEWAMSPDGQETFKMLSPEMRIALFGHDPVIPERKH